MALVGVFVAKWLVLRSMAVCICCGTWHLLCMIWRPNAAVTAIMQMCDM
jgi:hypothetical protein